MAHTDQLDALPVSNERAGEDLAGRGSLLVAGGCAVGGAAVGNNLLPDSKTVVAGRRGE